jgi:hypothetical protein
MDIMEGIYKIKGLYKTRLYVYIATMACLTIVIGADAIGIRDRIRAYKSLVVIMYTFWIRLINRKNMFDKVIEVVVSDCK